MFDYEQPPPKAPVDYTGLKIVAALAPLFFVFVYIGKPDLGLTACIVLGLGILAVKLNWELRKHPWFWAVIALTLAVQLPLLLRIHWPNTSAPTLVYTMPIGIAEFLLIMGAIRLARWLFLKGSAHNGDQQA